MNFEDIFMIVKLQTDANVKIIVGKTFDDLVLGSPENVLLEVCISSFCYTYVSFVGLNGELDLDAAFR